MRPLHPCSARRNPASTAAAAGVSSAPPSAATAACCTWPTRSANASRPSSRSRSMRCWLRLRVRRELQPLQTLSERLRMHDPLARSPLLGAAERAELAPVHAAIDALGQRLADRVAQERAFATHAAHALRTPLAGMDAQLAVALREVAPEHQPRLQ